MALTFTFPQRETQPHSETFIDPASESQSDASEGLPKKKKSKKTSVLAEIKAQRKHLDPILEEQEVVEQGQKDKGTGKLPPSHGSKADKLPLPFKVG